jgi:nitrogen regulatory protein PII
MLIRCVVGAEYLSAFVEGMMNIAPGLTVLETREHSPGTQHTISYRGVPYEIGALSVIVDLVSDESWIEDVIRRVHEGNKNEEFRVRHLHVLPVEASYHIRNGFMDV